MTDFEQEYWDHWQSSGAIRPTSWRGIPMIKDPVDVYLFAEAIHRTKPKLIIETGTWHGGSAAMFADLGARVISIDPEPEAKPIDSRITYITQSSLYCDLGWKASRMMVVLDSLHTRDHVKRELARFAGYVTPGCYLVVEDTIGVARQGAGEAAREFLAAWPDEWEEDTAMSRFGVTFNTWIIRR